MPELRLSTPVQFLPGVGPKKAAVLGEHGLLTVRDLLGYFPRSYLDRTNVVPINRLRVNTTATIIGTVMAHGMLFGKRRWYEVILQDDSGALTLTWFAGLRFYEKMFKKGQIFAATGTVTFFNSLQMIHPDLERLEDNSDKMIHAGRIIPVYPQTADLIKIGLNSKWMRRLTTVAVENLNEQFEEPLPANELSRYALNPMHESIVHIHYPESREQIEQCRRRIAFDELLNLQFYVHRNKGRKAGTVKKHSYKAPGEKLTALKHNLPFTLTDEQKKVVREIVADLQKPRPMSRLLHGDVGCGKTVVAVLAAAYAAENNLQCAFMAPTEILAEQHYRNWAEPLAAVGISSALLTSTVKGAQKKAIAKAAGDGDTQILFGTHALIYDYVTFAKLGLIIIDEQHRFGVEQRGRLFAKGESPDLLVMTATPIPRTLALTLYGDLDISAIEKLPPGRKPIRTVWRGEDAIARVYQYIRDEVKKGAQAYIIYPLIEKSEQSELKNVEDAYAELTAGPFKDIRVGLVHGRIKAKDRDQILLAFRNGDLDVLLSTTVIEVGIDNPNATIMLVEHAERFGLAQLHQLRGRVGRGEKQSTVIALAYEPVSDIAKERLQMLTECGDGFQIAEADLMLRGPGEIFGLRQSGLPDLRAANFRTDKDLLEGARTVTDKLFAEHGHLDQSYQVLYTYLEQSADRRDVNLGGG